MAFAAPGELGLQAEMYSGNDSFLHEMPLEFD